MQKISKETANYRGSTTREMCLNCVMFRGLNCTLVQGIISPFDTCDKWEKKGATGQG